MNDQLMEIFSERTLFLGQEKCDIIRAQTTRIDLEKLDGIEWEKVRYLCVFDKRAFSSYTKNPLPQGHHLSNDGSWLIINRGDVALDPVLDKCQHHLCFLRIESFVGNSLDVAPMKKLRFLYIRNVVSYWGAMVSTNLKGLAQLSVLETLHLGGEFDFPILDVAPMTGLKDLALESISRVSGIKGLHSLHGLKRLSLSLMYNIEYLSFSSAQQLEYLSLERMYRLKEIEMPEQFPYLRHLYLSGTNLHIPYFDLSNMPLLEKADLSGNCSLQKIRGLEKLEKLTRLNISNTSISRIPEALRGKRLKQLDLSRLELEELPDWLPELGLSISAIGSGDGICLNRTIVKDMDMSIFYQSQEMILRWFEDRKKQNEVRLNEIKVVFLGDGDTGKSHTIARLLNDGGEPKDYTDQSTPGIVIKNKNYTLDGRNIQVHYWDFGGQEILHSMHRIFLTERTLYVVLVNARDETQDARARYWLHNIQSFAKNAPVVLVLNKIDQNPKAKVNEPDLTGKYPNLRQVVTMSALEFSQERFNRELTDALLEQIRQTGFLDVKWPIPWTRVKGELENMEANYIRGDEYRRICQRCSVDRNEKDLLHWFNDLGVSYYCGDDHKLEDYMILKPSWITNALYIILFNDCPQARNGLIPHASIHDLLREDPETVAKIRRVLPGVYYKWDEISYVLEVFHKSQLSFGAGTDHEFIPMLCDPASSPVARQYEEDESTLEFRMEFDYLPNNLLHQLMVDRKDELRMDHVWRTGALFAQPETGFSAVVAIDGDVLRFFVQSGDPMHRPNTYLTMLKANVDRIWQKMGLKEPKNWLIYKYHGKKAVFRYERILKLHTKNRETEYCEELDQDFLIEDILNQSAPTVVKDEKALLDALIRACQSLQGNRKYWDWNENDRNTVVRDFLRARGYLVNDQTLQGSSGTGNGTGELDLDIRRLPNEPWTICEALIVKGYSRKWNEHLDKLLNQYNPYGLPVLYLLTYVDCDQESFGTVWGKYQDHIREDAPVGFALAADSVRTGLFEEYGSTRAAKCTYKKGSYAPTVYHIFARIGA